MQINYAVPFSEKNKLLCVTHSDRPFNPDRCDLNFLEKRYGKVQTHHLDQFDSLPPASEQLRYSGSVTIWNFKDNSFSKPTLVAHLIPKTYKPQYAIWHK